jgi:hypothetical protein
MQGREGAKKNRKYRTAKSAKKNLHLSRVLLAAPACLAVRSWSFFRVLGGLGGKILFFQEMP